MEGTSSESEFFQQEKCQQNDQFAQLDCVIQTAAGDAIESNSQCEAEEIAKVVDEVCSSVVSLLDQNADAGQDQQQEEMEDDEELAKNGVDIVLKVAEPTTQTTNDVDEQQQTSAADESAMCRFGIVRNVEIAIPRKKFDRLLEFIKVEMTQCHGKKKTHLRKTKTDQMPRLNANDTAGKKRKKGMEKMPKFDGDAAGQKRKKQLEKISEFEEELAPFLLNVKEDPIFVKCTKIRGMTDVMAFRIVHINQFLCHFITFIPEDKLGNINNKNSFTNFNMSIVQKSLDDKEMAEILEEKMMCTLATTINYALLFEQCKEGISYAMRTFPRLDHFLAVTSVC